MNAWCCRIQRIMRSTNTVRGLQVSYMRASFVILLSMTVLVSQAAHVQASRQGFRSGASMVLQQELASRTTVHMVRSDTISSVVLPQGAHEGHLVSFHPPRNMCVPVAAGESRQCGRLHSGCGGMDASTELEEVDAEECGCGAHNCCQRKGSCGSSEQRRRAHRAAGPPGPH